MLLKDPTAASKSADDKLPLHLAVDSNDNTYDNLAAVQLLFDAYPEALTKGDRHGDTPLDIARRFARIDESEITSSVVEFLEAQLAYASQAEDATAMTTPDESGCLPLHHALYNKASLGAIKLLVKGNPAALQVADHHETLPLHIACELCSVEIVQFLVDQNNGLNHCDARKNFPLHYACRGANYDVVKHLLEMSAPFISERNDDNKLPIHLLIESEQVGRESLKYVEGIWLLLRSYPETVLNFF